VFTDEIIAVPDVDLMHDECIRPATSLEGLAALRPVFRPDNGTVTAGNSSPLNDGAACLRLADEAGVARVGREPLARIVARAISAVTPQHSASVGRTSAR
jgi:acetyl-CoA acyltransferase